MIGIAALFFAAVAPTLSWSEFSGDSEDLLVRTVLEMRHGGPWWVPTMAGRPRIRKPPLPAWISAAAVRHSTIRNLNNPDSTARDIAYRQLAWQVRWPSVVAGCLTLLAVGWLASTVGGPAHVVPAVLICATSLLFLRFIRQATSDVHLALWVTVANACFAAAILRNRQWLGFAGGGVALGIALMSKGPVALLETLLPFTVYWLIHPRRSSNRAGGPKTGEKLRTIPIIVGVLLTLAVAVPWPVALLLSHPGVVHQWLNEIEGEGAAGISHDPAYAYVSLLPNLLPWLPLFIAGVYITLYPARRAKRINLALLLVIVPILALSFHHDRKERYLLPLSGPAAILAAHAAVRLKRAWPTRLTNDRLVWGFHWFSIAAFGVGLPMAGYFILRRHGGEAWYPFPLSIFTLAICAVGISAAALKWQAQNRLSFVFAGAAMMLMLNALLIYGLCRSDAGLSEMRPIAERLRALPGGTDGRIVYFDPPPAGKPVTLDLDIYLDRSVSVISEAPPSKAYANAMAIVLLRREPDPEPHFAGWHTAFDLMGRRHHWYVLTPTSP